MKSNTAKEKWCPFVRVIAKNHNNITTMTNRPSTHSGNTRCLVKECMSWVEIDEEEGYCQLIEKR